MGEGGRELADTRAETRKIINHTSTVGTTGSNACRPHGAMPPLGFETYFYPLRHEGDKLLISTVLLDTAFFLQ